MNELEAQSIEQLDHVRYMILFVSSLFLADQIVYLINSTVAFIFAPIVDLLGNSGLALIILIITLIITRLILYYLPGLGISAPPNPFIVFLPALIYAHPLIISVEGTNFLVNWSLIDRLVIDGTFVTSNLIDWIIETLIILFMAFGVLQIGLKSEKDMSGPEVRYLKYLGNDFVNVGIIVIVIIYLIRSFIINDFQGVDLTRPIKFILILLLSLIFYPIKETQ